MRVLLVANTLPPDDLSGVGEQVVQLAAGLAERGHEVRVLGRGPTGARGPKLLFPLAVVPALRRAVRELRPDVVQVHESDGALAARWLASVRNRLQPRPTLVALLQVSYREERRAVRPLRHGERVLGRPGGAERRFRLWKAPLQARLGAWTARTADLVLAPSAATAAELVRDYGARDPQVLPNVTGGLGDDRSAPSAAASLPAEFLLFVGRLRIRKGVEVLLEALRGVPLPMPLIVAGDGEHRRALEAHALRCGLGPERVRFLGRASREQVRWLLERARALIVPSIYEGMPLVVLEAMAAARPVIASAVSGIPEVVADGDSGWLVPAEDPPALAAALRAAVADAGEAARRGETGRRRVDAAYRPRHAAAIWERLVAQLRGGQS